jgi:hypothetical protein
MWNDFKSWGAKPFSADMDALHWFYFLGLLLALSFMWGLILRTMKEVTS